MHAVRLFRISWESAVVCTIYRHAVGLVLGLLLAAPPAASAAESAKDYDTLLAKAQAAEQARQFGKALDFYLKAHLAGERSDAVRERIHDCLRHVEQSRRLRDPAFRQHVAALPVSEALNLYAELVKKLSTHYADRELSRPERLFTLSLQEVDRALADPAFRKAHLPKATDAQRAAFTRRLRDDWPLRLPTTPREARAALQEVVRAAVDDLAMTEPAAIVLEAIGGACTGLDESTTYAPHITKLEAKADEPTLTAVEMTDPMAGVGRIAIGRFREGTPAEFEQAVQRLKSLGLRSLVLDLRGNTGGSFPAAVRIAERFVARGTLATTVGQLPEFNGRLFASTTGVAALDTPLVVLVDAKTMSAAEVLAAALKDTGRATLIGMPTFGKGTIQSPVPLDGDMPGQLTVTIARVLGPAGVPLQGQGVTPLLREPDPALQDRLALGRARELADAVQ
jgi:hypothetical protein